MQIVIDIDEDYYEIIKHDVDKGMDYLPCVLIAKGAPLPKGHGGIIDESKITEVYKYSEERIFNNIKAINTTITHTDAPTIIEGGN